MNLQPVFIREQLIKSIREFFYAGKFHEIITPSFNTALPLEPNIYAFETIWQTIHGEKKLYLSTSPESGLKKMIAAGISNCFAIGKSFRNLEDAGSTHIPEFLMLEWYRKNATYSTIMEDTEHLIRFISKKNTITYQNQKITLSSTWPRHSLTSLFKQYASLDLEQLLDDAVIRSAAQKKGYSVTNATWEQLFNQIFLNEIEPKLGMNPCFVTDFPARISPLCTLKKDAPDFTERFEVYLAGMELGNGNTENTDVERVRTLFNKEKQERQKKKILTPPIDDVFLHALDTMANNTYAGIGLGVDRLAMILAGTTTITDVEPLAVK